MRKDYGGIETRRRRAVKRVARRKAKRGKVERKMRQAWMKPCLRSL
jgi:hypothetical protein